MSLLAQKLITAGFRPSRTKITPYLLIIYYLAIFVQDASARIDCHKVQTIKVNVSAPLVDASRQTARKRAIRIGLRRAVARAGGAEVREQFSSKSSVAGSNIEQASSVKLTQRTKGRVQAWKVVSETITHTDDGAEIKLAMNTKVCVEPASALASIVVLGDFKNVDKQESRKLKEVVASNVPDSQSFVLKLSAPRKSYYDVKVSGVISDPVSRQINQADKKRMLSKFLGDTNVVRSIATRKRRVVVTAAVKATYQPSGESIVETYAAERDLTESNEETSVLSPNLLRALAERAVNVSSKALFSRMERRKANRE